MLYHSKHTHTHAGTHDTQGKAVAHLGNYTAEIK